MTQSTKRMLSTVAIVIASVAFGVLVSADLGLLRPSQAQTATTAVQTPQGPVVSVTIPSFADLAARAMPAVVSVNTTEIVKGGDLRRRFGIDPFDFFPDPRDPRRRDDDDEDGIPQRGGGSGFIISQDGYILTNNHVVEGATKVDVHFGADENGAGGRTISAKIVGRDAATDLALLKIDVDGPLPYLALGDSDTIRRGDWAIAIGNPFALENTLTVGVISAKGRSINTETESRSFDNFIQTDAAINFGNSGGPLMNIRGEVIGINSAIRGGAQNLGFAIPVNTAKRLVPQLKQGRVTRSYLGMQIQEVTEEIREAFSLKEARGALVQNVDAGKPADKAGIRHGDVIVEIDGKKINTNRDLIDYISYLPVGTNVKVVVIRNGERMTLNAKTAERPNGEEAETEETENTAAPTMNKLGISVQDLTPQTRRMYNHRDDVRGVVVTSVKRVSAAAEAGIAEGDVISEVQGQSIGTVDDLRALLEKTRSGQRIRAYVTTAPRNGNSISGYRVIQVP